VSTRATPVIVYLESPRLAQTVSLSIGFADGAKPVCIDETQSIDDSSRFTDSDLAILESSFMNSAKPLFSDVSVAKPPGAPTLRVLLLNHIIEIVSQNERLAMAEVYAEVSRDGNTIAKDRFTVLTEQATWVKDLKGNLNRAIISRSLALLSASLRKVPFNPASPGNHTSVFQHTADAMELFPDDMHAYIKQYPQWDGPISEFEYAARIKKKLQFVGVAEETNVSSLVAIHWGYGIRVEQIAIGQTEYAINRRTISPFFASPGAVRLRVSYTTGTRLECAVMDNTAYGPQCSAYRQIPITKEELLDAGAMQAGSALRVCLMKEAAVLIKDGAPCP
jgi:hypothetical protein